MNRVFVAILFLIGLTLICVGGYPVFCYTHSFDTNSFERMKSAGLPEETAAKLDRELGGQTFLYDFRLAHELDRILGPDTSKEHVKIIHEAARKLPALKHIAICSLVALFGLGICVIAYFTPMN